MTAVDETGQAFGAWLRQALRDAGRTYAQLARYLGVDQAQVSRWVRGRQPPDPAMSERIAAALGLPERLVLEKAGHRAERGAPDHSVEAAPPAPGGHEPMPQPSAADLAPEHDEPPAPSTPSPDMTLLERIAVMRSMLDAIEQEARREQELVEENRRLRAQLAAVRRAISGSDE